MCRATISGEDEIRTRGTLIEYVSLANWWFQPLTHLSNQHHVLVKRDCKYTINLLIYNNFLNACRFIRDAGRWNRGGIQLSASLHFCVR